MLEAAPTSAGDAHPGGPGCWENRHLVMEQREEGKEPAPDPAAESEKLIIARRPEMHPMVIEPPGTSPLGKEATARPYCADVGCGWSARS